MDKTNKKSLLKLSPKWIPVAGLVCGLFLLICGNSLFPENKAEEEPEMIQYYTEFLEKRIEKLCTSVEGVREAEVLLTLENNREYVYAVNGASDGQALEYVIINRGEGEEAVLLTEICPQVRGVAVVCTGGHLPAVKQTIIKLLSASLGISSNRIHVAGTGGISET